MRYTDDMDPRLAAKIREARKREGTTPVSVRFPPRLAEKLLAAAGRLRCTRAEIVRASVAMALEE